MLNLSDRGLVSPLRCAVLLFALFALLVKTSTAQANCIMDEVAVQGQSMEGYYPPEIARSFIDAGIQTLVQSVIYHPEKRAELEQKTGAMIKVLNARLHSQAAIDEYIESVDTLVRSNKPGVSIWQKVLAQAARVCVERGALPETGTTPQ